MAMVEADYRMKLIGIGLEKPPVRMVSYVDRRQPGGRHRNAMQRWYFMPDYQCVRTADDGKAMELVGDGVKLVGENELVSAEGQRHSVARCDPASQAFVSAFTKQYSALADRSPVYAELRNLIDLAVAAAYMQQREFLRQGRVENGFIGQRKELRRRDLQHAEASGHGRQRHLERA